MKLLQPSFSSGEISPLLHARVDLARYRTACATLKNFIVLPQGGITRRPGTKRVKRAEFGKYVKLIPFVYSTGDCLMLEFAEKRINVLNRDGAVLNADRPLFTPYLESELKDLRYAQNGNIVVVTHINHPPYMLERDITDGTMGTWSFNEINFQGSPFNDPPTETADANLTVSGRMDNTFEITSDTADTFKGFAKGSQIALDYQMPPKSDVSTVRPADMGADGWWYSGAYEVTGVLSVLTEGKWRGEVEVQRSADRQATWFTVEKTTNDGSDSPKDIRPAEAEQDMFFRVRAKVTGGDPLKLTINTPTFVKTYTYRVLAVSADNMTVHAERVYRPGEGGELIAPDDAQFLGWQVSAWGNGTSAGSGTGYPRCCAFYQNRLVLAASAKEPNTLWLSRVDDYTNFGATPANALDDDPITMTITASTGDGIHSLVAADDLLAFTNAGEWKIRGAGDSGAITPSAVTAHQQSAIGSKAIQPLLTHDGRVVFVQTHGRKVYSIVYDFSRDGYSAQELSVLSGHLFEWPSQNFGLIYHDEIADFGWQKVPDGLLWFVLENGDMAVCTYNVEHEVCGWASASLGGNVLGVGNIPGDGETEQWLVVRRGGTVNIEKFARRVDELLFEDDGAAFTSLLSTLRVTADSDGTSMYPAKKYISRLTVSGIRCSDCEVMPCVPGVVDGYNAKRARKMAWRWANHVEDREIQCDSGFAYDAAVRISVKKGPMTILAVSPLVTFGG